MESIRHIENVRRIFQLNIREYFTWIMGNISLNIGEYFTWIWENILHEYWQIFHLNIGKYFTWILWNIHLNIEEYCISPEYGGIFHLNMGEFFTWILGNISLSLRQWSTPLGRGGNSSIVKETVWNIYHIETLQKYNLTKSKIFLKLKFCTSYLHQLFY